MTVILQTTAKMLGKWTYVAALYTLATLAPASCDVKQEKRSRTVWYKAKEEHQGLGLSDEELRAIAGMSDMNHFKAVLDPIMIPRVVGTENHAKVRKHLIDTMKGLGWTVEEDVFDSNTPVGRKTFTNVIATLDPHAPRHLVLACHYDSKIDREGTFIGATDSAVPCAMMLNMAKVMQANLENNKKTCLKVKRKKNKQVCSSKKNCTKKKVREFWKKNNRRKPLGNQSLMGSVVNQNDATTGSDLVSNVTLPQHNLKYFGKLKCCCGSEPGNSYKLMFIPKVQSDLTLQFVFFDGEEAFRTWSKTDSLYGARNLAAKLQNQLYPEVNKDGTNQLHRMDLFVLLDLLGTEDVQFFNYFKNTDRWYARMLSYERRLSDLGMLNKRLMMFKQRSMLNPGIEDDHIPFLQRGVPVVHLIPVPFPSVWHEDSDNATALNYETIQNLNIIMRAFVADYLHLVV
ncbi:glutaminyl-peptide cyclotransferase-like isoform X1 [Macrobrachium nipponense]|uniref:glutaminyl-peptide cyclotransferase-like isoform X1 n=1 Tax=Macrobrachium nipponense TaxID=159736 RepID=UPI0030C7E7AA